VASVTGGHDALELLRPAFRLPQAMMFLPIVERELRVGSRRSTTYYSRMAVAAVGMIILSSMLLQSGNLPPGYAGKVVFTSTSVLAMAFCLFGGGRSTADCLSEEKRDGTLGLLFLTDLKGYDVVFGKLAATSLSLLYGILALVPLFGLAISLGGVTVGEFARVTLVLINSLWLALSVGMWVSARSHNDQKAVWTTAVMVSLLAGFTFLIDLALSWGQYRLAGGLFSMLSPAFACSMAFDANYGSSPARFWFSAGLTHLAAWGLLIAASRSVAHRWHEEATVSRGARLWNRWDQWSRRRSARSGQWRRPLLDLNPILWLQGRYRRDRAWILVIGFSLLVCFATVRLAKPAGPGGPPFWMMVFNGSGLISLLLMILMASHASRFFSEGRRTGTLELLLTTPLSQEAILTGQRRTFARRLAWSVLLILTWRGANLFFQLRLMGASATITMGSGVVDYRHYVLFTALGELLIFITSLYSLSWVGMWLGLVAGKPSQAATRTFIYVLVIPWFAMSFFQFTALRFASGWSFLIIPVLFILKDLIFVRWAKAQLRQDLRYLASQSLSLQPAGQLPVSDAPVLSAPSREPTR
jgi:ABC-type Na+ efflux pump permease subunit